MVDPESRAALLSIIDTLQALVKQVNEATISTHAVRMAIDETDKPMTVRIHKRYQKLETSSKPIVDQVSAELQQLAQTLGSNPSSAKGKGN